MRERTYFRLGRKAPVVPGESREYVVARYLEIEIAISRPLSYLRLIQDRAFLKTMVINIIIIIFYSLRLNTRRGLRAHGRIRLVWVPPSSARRGPNLGGGARARERRARTYVYYIYSLRHRP